MGISTLYYDHYRGDFTATGASITSYGNQRYLKSPEITEPDIYQATRGYLTIPSTAKVEKAYLVWATDDHRKTKIDYSSLYLRTPASASDKLEDAYHIQTEGCVYEGNGTYDYYGFSYEVTELVKKGGSGNYWVYNFDIVPKNGISNKAGWSLYVFYKDDTLSYKSFNFYAGLLGVGVLFDDTVEFVLDNIRTPPIGPVLGRIGATTIFSTRGELDWFYVNDVAMYDAYTPPDDFANSISTLNNELMDTWPPQTVPANNNSEEYQTKVVALSGHEVPNNANLINVRLVNNPAGGVFAGDLIVSVVTAFELYSTSLSVVKTVDNEKPYVKDTLTYNLEVSNSSDYAIGINTVLKDTLPTKLTYVPGSMKIVSNSYGGYIGSLTDPVDSDVGSEIGRTVTINLGSDATSTDGGTLMPGDSVTVQFKAYVNDTANVGDIIENKAVVSITSADTGEDDEYYAMNDIEIDASPYPVKKASQYYFRTYSTSDIDFNITYITNHVKDNSSVIVIEDDIDSVLQIRSCYLDLIPSAGITIVDETIGNHVKYRITTNGQEDFPESFNLNISTTYLKDTISSQCYIIKNTATIQINSDDLLESNTVYVESISKREQSKIDLIESVALEQTALSHIINAEGEKIQRVLEISDSREDFIAINKSVLKTVDSITKLELILKSKLKFAKDKSNGCHPIE